VGLKTSTLLTSQFYFSFSGKGVSKVLMEKKILWKKNWKNSSQRIEQREVMRKEQKYKRKLW
jgi:hypothetical protein